MKNTKDLLKLAESLSYKYAGVSAETYRPEIEKNIREALANMSQQNNVQVMLPFLDMINKDHVTLNFNVTRNDDWAGKHITVSNFTVIPNENNAFERYVPLAKQIEEYLENNWELYPTQRNGAALDYNNFTIQCEYSPNNSTNTIARN